jgi:hypothetical protein
MTPASWPCYLPIAVPVQSLSITWLAKRRALGVLAVLAAGCGGARASTVPLGGQHVEEQPTTSVRASASAQAPALPVAVASAAPGEDEDHAEETEIVAAKTPDSNPAASATKPAVGAFQVIPYKTGQAWTRSFDLEFNVKLGPGTGVEMRMVSHQEARFEVLAASAGSLDRLAIEYPVYTSKVSAMGGTQDSPEEVAGKRYVISFAQGKPDVKSASGGTPPKKELDTVKDDAREPLEIITALKELTQLAAKGKGDFSTAGAVALAGGEDEDTKVSGARAALRQISSGARGEKSALIDLSYTLTNAADETSSILAQLSGSVLVLDAPSRYQSVTLSGPLELRSHDADGGGRGTTKITVTYKY